MKHAFFSSIVTEEQAAYATGAGKARLMPDSRKQSLYFPGEMLSEIHAEAKRQDRSVSNIMQLAWRIAKAQLTSMPGVPERK